MSQHVVEQKCPQEAKQDLAARSASEKLIALGDRVLEAQEQVKTDQSGENRGIGEDFRLTRGLLNCKVCVRWETVSVAAVNHSKHIQQGMKPMRSSLGGEDI